MKNSTRAGSKIFFLNTKKADLYEIRIKIIALQTDKNREQNGMRKKTEIMFEI